ncbi:PAS domain-containing response regulator [Halapricum hydrolyticum]|uniref:Response regulator n=1 Tax=Halapricum hydrolyticum TaxID=2979991 RepID=A0AAE3LDQ3_9EURY|nr:response regulator [Halapricum hydrolyticum]MCU4716949.1 response regulator [Halapricum hydrolyticum]MCU4725446.1 response regulator [Halapricum hydrolyticum]
MDESFRVLAVDDDPGISELITEFLPREDDRFIVETATSATEAIDRFDQEVFDAIISDYQMPDVDGLDFLETIRDDFDSDIPFIIFTGKGREEVAIDALNFGADRYLQKGGDPTSQYSVLADAVRNEIEKHQTKAELRALNQELTAQNQQLEAYTEQLETTEQRLRDEIEERKKREQELKRHKRLLDALFDFVPIHLFIKDRKGRHLWVSSEFYDDPERWIGNRDTEVEYDVPEEFSEEAYEDDMQVIEEGERIIDKETYDEARGRYFLTSKVPWRDEDGDVVGLLGYSFDVTEQKEREQRLQTIINNLPGIVYRCKQQPGWPMEMVRGRAEELTGYTADEIERGTVSWGDDIIHPEDRNWVWEDVNRATSGGEPFELTYRIQTRSGERRWVWEQGQPARTGGDVTQIEGFIMDIPEDIHSAGQS